MTIMAMSFFWQAVLYLHLVAMALFAGGQLVFGIAVVPVLREDEGRGRMRAVARRFGYGSLAALAVLVATGWAMASHCDLQAAILLATLAIVWLGLELAV